MERRKEDPVAMQNYDEVNEEIRRRMKEARENWIADQDRCKEIYSGFRTGNSKAAFDNSK